MANNKKKSKKKKKHRFFWAMVKLQVFLMVLVLGAFSYYYFGGYAKEVQQLKKEAAEEVAASDESIFVPSQTSTIYDVNGEVLSKLSGDKASDYVKYEDTPAYFSTALISIEDKKFYSHPGVDYKAIFRAVKAMIQNGHPTQGGSTITMQLAKLTFMESGKTWQYKVKQMFLAMDLEKRYSKKKIMEFYLNNINFANNYYGIKAACTGYFNCELYELDLSQIAFLCAIPNSPSYYDPIVNMDHTITRRNLILKNMLEDGKISQTQYDEAVAEDIVLNIPQKNNSEKHNYVDTYVYYSATRAMMRNSGFQFRYYFDSEQEEQEYDEEYDQMYAECQKKIFSGGYKVYTSIDMDKQEALQKSVDEHLAGFESVSEDGMYEMQGAAVCIDNENGLVAAIVGGRSQDFSTYTLNRAFQSHRQPGSSIKPLVVYTPMFERGYTPDSTVVDKKIEGGPDNASKTYMGKVNVRTAVAKSLNTVAWQLYEELTPEVGLSYLKEMNFSKLVEEDNTMATSLGGFTNGVSPLEMAAAYATLENDGKYREPSCILSIINGDDNVVYAAEQDGKEIYDQTAARMMTDVMQTVMESGTGKNVKLSNMNCAGKTGTTNSQKDGWFVGYTPYYTTSVWVGYDLPKKVEGLTGSSYPGQIWKDFMEIIHEDLSPIDFLPYAQLSTDFQQKKAEQQQKQKEKRENADKENNQQDVEPAGTADDADGEQDNENDRQDIQEDNENDRQDVQEDNENAGEEVDAPELDGDDLGDTDLENEGGGIIEQGDDDIAYN